MPTLTTSTVSTTCADGKTWRQLCHVAHSGCAKGSACMCTPARAEKELTKTCVNTDKHVVNACHALSRGKHYMGKPASYFQGTVVGVVGRCELTCCNCRFLSPILCAFQACLGSPATSSHCSQTPKLALWKASFCLPRLRSCRNLSSADADLKPTQLPCGHCHSSEPGQIACASV